MEHIQLHFYGSAKWEMPEKFYSWTGYKQVQIQSIDKGVVKTWRTPQEAE